jgi:hypothetical protein
MNKLSIRYPLLALLVVLAMVFAVSPAAAQEPGDEVEITGTVASIDEEAGSFTVEVEGGETYVVFPPEGFDTTLAEGDIVTVQGTLNEDGSVSALEVMLEEDEAEEEDIPLNTGYYCTQSEVPHPFGARLAETYEVEYATLQGWFCEGFGWGQVMLALQTGAITGEDPEALLELRRGGSGWGQIWQELKLIGKPEHAGPPNDLDGDGRPDHAGPKTDKENKGKPDHAGPPDGVGPPNNRP